MLDQIDSQIPADEQEADALLNEIEQPAPDLMSEADKQAADKTQQAIQEYSFNYGGKEVKAPIEKILKWASQGYEAPNKIGELNKQIESWKSKEATLKELESKYGDVDKYVRENPQWWDFVSKQYEQNAQQAQLQSQMTPELMALKQKVDELDQYKNNIVQQQEDAEYNKQFSELKKQYASVDFTTPDDSGKSLEYKVLEYANANGIRKFSTAFKDFYHDELVKIAAESAKEKLINDKQSKSKLGILNISSAPTKRTTDSVRGKSYGDLEREALAELGIA